VSIASFLTYKSILGGVVGLSGMHALDVDWSKEVDIELKKQTKVFLYHGKSDPLIPAAFSKQIY
jgi:predicted esterase